MSKKTGIKKADRLELIINEAMAQAKKDFAKISRPVTKPQTLDDITLGPVFFTQNDEKTVVVKQRD